MSRFWGDEINKILRQLCHLAKCQVRTYTGEHITDIVVHPENLRKHCLHRLYTESNFVQHPRGLWQGDGWLTQPSPGVWGSLSSRRAYLYRVLGRPFDVHLAAGNAALASWPRTRLDTTISHHHLAVKGFRISTIQDRFVIICGGFLSACFSF